MNSISVLLLVLWSHFTLEIVSFNPGAEENVRPAFLMFGYTGSVQSFVVPAGVRFIDVDVYGARGGNGVNNVCSGGKGGRVQSTLAVIPNNRYFVFVGNTGVDHLGGFNGGGDGVLLVATGGGGASDIRVTSGPADYLSRIVTAGGGGGCAFICGSTDGGHGGHIGGTPAVNSCGKGGGGGASVTAAGAAGECPDDPEYICGNDGELGHGAAGAADDGSDDGGGGGGGGYYGGGSSDGSAGGGGSSYSASSANTVYSDGVSGGVGSVLVSFVYAD